MVSGESDTVESFALAVAYCSGYHKSARTAGHQGKVALYDCVAMN